MGNDVDVGLSVLTLYALIVDWHDIANRLISWLFNGHLSRLRRLAIDVHTPKQSLTVYPEPLVYDPPDVSETTWPSIFVDELSDDPELEEPSEEGLSEGPLSCRSLCGHHLQ
jgi:hypothetical protein